MDYIPSFLNCPRCGDRAYERLQTYSHCVACLYSPVFDEAQDVPEWAVKYAKETAQKFSKAQKRKVISFTAQESKPDPALAPHVFKTDVGTVEVFNLL